MEAGLRLPAFRQQLPNIPSYQLVFRVQLHHITIRHRSKTVLPLFWGGQQEQHSAIRQAYLSTVHLIQAEMLLFIYHQD